MFDCSLRTCKVIVCEITNSVRTSQYSHCLSGDKLRDVDPNLGIGMIAKLWTTQAAQTHFEDEGPETRSLSKLGLYNQLNARFFLPHPESKGVNRRWLLQIYNGNAYRIEHSILRRFEFDIPKSLQKKASLVSLMDVVVKLDRYLVELGQKTLGFQDGIIPEEEYLLKVLRYVDQANIMGVFSGPINNAVERTVLSNQIFKAQCSAQEYLLSNQLMENQNVFNGIKALAETNKKLSNLRQDIKALEEELRSSREKQQTTEANLNSYLLKASTTLVAFGNRMPNPELMFDESQGQAYRDQLQQISKL